MALLLSLYYARFSKIDFHQFVGVVPWIFLELRAGKTPITAMRQKLLRAGSKRIHHRYGPRHPAHSKSGRVLPQFLHADFPGHGSIFGPVAGIEKQVIVRARDEFADYSLQAMVLCFCPGIFQLFESLQPEKLALKIREK